MVNNVENISDKIMERSFKGFPHVETSLFKGVEFSILKKSETQYQLLIAFYSNIKDNDNQGFTLRTGSIEKDLNKIIENIGFMINSGIFKNIPNMNTFVQLFNEDEISVAILDIAPLIQSLIPAKV